MSAAAARGSDVELSICVPVYRDHAVPNISTLLADLPDAADGLAYEVIVVLNGLKSDLVPTDDRVRRVTFEENRGVPVAWNAAAATASGPVLVIVNDDVRLGTGALRMLHAALQKQEGDGGVVGPVGTHWDIRTPKHLSYVDTTALAPGQRVPCEVLSGFLFATPRDVWSAVGGFDEAYTPCGFEEIDYCTTVRLVAGRPCEVVAGVPFEHQFGVSAQRSWRRVRYDRRSESLKSIARRNRRHFRAKWSTATSPNLSASRAS